MEKTVAEFFAGIGLMRMGLEAEGWSVSVANDIDPQKLDMYQANFLDNQERFVLCDIHDFDAAIIPTVSLATASFPCNDLSIAGARHGLMGKNSSAFWGFIGVLAKLKSRRPGLLLIENVPGFLTSHNGRDFEDALTALNDLGYSVDALIIDAASFVPQSRQRLFVVGILRPSTLATGIAEVFYESSMRPAGLANFIFNHPNINWLIRQLPEVPTRTTNLGAILEDLPPESHYWWNHERSTYLLNQMSPRHRETANKMIAMTGWSYGTIFRRIRNGKSMAELRTDGIAGCLRTPRGGSARQILLKAGNGEAHIRLLTPRECARLMGADNYKINVPANQAFFGFGDAVCVPVIRWIARHYLNPLAEEMMSLSSINSGCVLQSATYTHGQI